MLNILYKISDIFFESLVHLINVVYKLKLYYSIFLLPLIILVIKIASVPNTAIKTIGVKHLKNFELVNILSHKQNQILELALFL